MDNFVKIYFDGLPGAVAPGSEISVSVLVDATSAINAFDLSVIYPPSKFKFLGSDNTGSIVDIWQTKPIAETPGRIELSGGILDSYAGSKGHVIKFSFQVLDSGGTTDSGKISFIKSDFFLSDGKGTKVSATSSDYNVSVKEDGEVVSTPIIPFQSTPTDVLIENEINNLKAKEASGNWMMFWLVLALVIFVICFVTVYNKTKRKL